MIQYVQIAFLLGGATVKIIKRCGEEVEFDITKIISAVHKANREVQPGERLTTEQIQKIARKSAERQSAL